MRKLGLIAGGGSLPVEIAEHCQRSGRPLFVVRLKGFAGEGLERYAGAEVGLAELGKCFKALKRAGCEAVCLAGQVNRPDFSSLMPDLRGLAALPAAIAAARKGDDALLRMLVGEFEKEGFAVEGAHEVMDDLGLGEGLLGRVAPGPEHATDVAQALEVARAVGRLDAGQGAVVCRGLVLALEAAEGTDAMLARIGTLRESLRGTAVRKRGVLVKALKPTQDAKTDMPVVGVQTVRNAAAVFLAGIAVEAGAALILDKAAVAAEADRLGLFVTGLKP
jgi:DUF1009 family protein